MAESNHLGVSLMSMKAGGTIAINRAVVLDSTANQVVATSAITNAVIGFSTQAASSGDTLPIQVFGKAKARLGAGGATLGAQLMPEASGAGDLVVAAGATAISCAIALQAGSEGDTIEVFFPGPSVNAPANS